MSELKELLGLFPQPSPLPAAGRAEDAGKQHTELREHRAPAGHKYPHCLPREMQPSVGAGETSAKALTETQRI